MALVGEYYKIVEPLEPYDDMTSPYKENEFSMIEGLCSNGQHARRLLWQAEFKACSNTIGILVNCLKRTKMRSKSGQCLSRDQGQGCKLGSSETTTYYRPQDHLA